MYTTPARVCLPPPPAPPRICSYSLRREPRSRGPPPPFESYVLAYSPRLPHDPLTHFPLHPHSPTQPFASVVALSVARAFSPSLPTTASSRKRATSARAQERDDQQGDGDGQAAPRPALDHPGDWYVVWGGWRGWVGLMRTVCMSADWVLFFACFLGAVQQQREDNVYERWHGIVGGV